ncbi:MAG: hypothetical protein ACM359_18325 [Bacillota bacterium]
MRENTDPNCDTLYRRPRAWRQIKEAAKDACESIDELLLALENVEGYCPRIALVVAIHAFVAAGPKQRWEMLERYYEWYGRKRYGFKPGERVPEALASGELKTLQSDLEAAAEKIFGQIE